MIDVGHKSDGEPNFYIVQGNEFKPIGEVKVMPEFFVPEEVDDGKVLLEKLDDVSVTIKFDLTWRQRLWFWKIETMAKIRYWFSHLVRK